MLGNMGVLEEELRAAVAVAAMGQPLDGTLERDLGMAARGVLERHGLGGARVEVRREGRGLLIDVIPPPSAPQVRRISLRLG